MITKIAFHAYNRSKRSPICWPHTSQFIATIEKRQGLKVSCPEEIAFRKGWLNAEQLEKLAQPMLKNPYGQYLMGVLKERVF